MSAGLAGKTQRLGIIQSLELESYEELLSYVSDNRWDLLPGPLAGAVE